MLNDIQKQVAFKVSGNTIVSASPGSGKTKTLVARAQHKLTSLPLHKSIALITYTNAGADEIAERLVSEGNNIFIGTIHRFCLEYILRPYGWLYNWDRPKIVTYEQLNEFLSVNEDIDLGNNPLDELNKIKRLLNGEIDKNVDWNGRQSVEYISELFYVFLKSKNAIDFNEVLYRSYKIISNNEFVSTSLANKFYEIAIDEFQDTNIFQYEILKAINKNNICTFFMVGDEKQKIYRFAGAIDNAFVQASRDFCAPIISLEVTYRSTSNIIEAYSNLFKDHPKLLNKSKYKNFNQPVIITQTTDENNIACIENWLEHLIKKVNVELSEIAILTTSWFEAINISKSLRKKYSIVGMGALPHKNNNTSTFSLLRCLSRFLYSTSIRNLRIIKRNIELHTLENNLNLTETELSFITNTIITQLYEIDKDTELIEGILGIKYIFDKSFKINNSAFDEIINLINPDEAKEWSIGKYLETLAGLSGITVNTIHQSKGLEYEAVILNGVNEGRIPYQSWDRINRVRDPLIKANLEDGRTLFYVGISRAKAILLITHNWRPSLFIPVIKPINKL